MEERLFRPVFLSSELLLSLLDVETRTTVMIRKLPRKLTHGDLARMVDLTGEVNYDLLYVPVDIDRGCNRGYAFLCFRDPESCSRFKRLFASFEVPEALRGCEVVYAHVQGSEATLAYIGARRSYKVVV
jgi:hypothetical protein